MKFDDDIGLPGLPINKILLFNEWNKAAKTPIIYRFLH